MVLRSHSENGEVPDRRKVPQIVDKCNVCNDEIRFYGYCSCQKDDGFSLPALILVILLLLSFVYVFLQWFVFGNGYVYQKNTIVGIIQKQEAPFLKQFEERVKGNPSLKIIGWKCEVVTNWGLVTYHYTAAKGKDLERRAYFWAVDTDTRKVHRLESLKQFVDKFLLTEVPRPAKG